MPSALNGLEAEYILPKVEEFQLSNIIAPITRDYTLDLVSICNIIRRYTLYTINHPVSYYEYFQNNDKSNFILYIIYLFTKVYL